MIEQITKIFLDPDIVDENELEESLANDDVFQDLVKQALVYDEE